MSLALCVLDKDREVQCGEASKSWTSKSSGEARFSGKPAKLSRNALSTRGQKLEDALSQGLCVSECSCLSEWQEWRLTAVTPAVAACLCSESGGTSQGVERWSRSGLGKLGRASRLVLCPEAELQGPERLPLVHSRLRANEGSRPASRSLPGSPSRPSSVPTGAGV